MKEQSRTVLANSSLRSCLIRDNILNYVDVIIKNSDCNASCLLIVCPKISGSTSRRLLNSENKRAASKPPFSMKKCANQNGRIA